MAKKVVVFDNSGAKPTPHRAKVVKPAQVPKQPDKKAPRASAPQGNTGVKKAAQAEAKKESPAPYKTIFKEKYLADLKNAEENAKKMLAEEKQPDRDYFAERASFLAKLIQVFEAGNLETQVEFSPLVEALLWNEFQHLSALVHSGPTVQKPEGKKPSPAWNRAAYPYRKFLLDSLNRIRTKRDGYVMKICPASEYTILFCINGTILYIEKQMEAEPENDFLPQLRRFYQLVYEKSGMKKRARQIAAYLTEQLAKDRDYQIWKNQEIVDYFLAKNTGKGRGHVQPDN